MAKKKSKTGSKVLKYILFFVLTVILLVALLFSLVYFGAFGSLPTKSELSSISNEEASLVFSSDNVIIGKYFAENRTNIKWKDVPEHLKNALVATEDKRFFTHKGFDVFSYLRVFVKSIILRDNSGGGGSTLTQQLVKNLYGRKSYGIITMPVNKMKEAIIASRIEDIYTKEELLLLYLNSVPFGEDVYGVESAARRFFSKPARKLKAHESAVLIGMLKANTYYNPVLNPDHALARRNLVLSLMGKENYLTANEVRRLQKLPLGIDYENVNNNPAGYFVQQVKKKTLELIETINDETGQNYDLEKDGLKIYTTLNMQVQEVAVKAIKNHLSAMQRLLDKELEGRRLKRQWYANQKQLSTNLGDDNRKRKVRLFEWDGTRTQYINKFDSLWYYYKMLHASVLITNPKNGAVITWVGGNNFRMLPFDMVMSHRQIASAFKPVLYATALENGIEPCKYLENSKNKYEGYEDWEPENYDRASTADSTVALWYALTHSMNLPSVDLYFKVGREKLLNTCERLEFPKITEDAPSIALGTLDLSLYEVVKAYGAFANRGEMNELFMISKITDANGRVLYSRKPEPSENVFETETTEEITAILQQVINQGTGTRIRTRYAITSDLAGKTGTAQNYSNAWFVAYTPSMVIGTWVGASTPDIHFFSSNGSGSSLALPIAGNIIKNIEGNPGLRSKYLTSFNLSEEVYSFLQCPPYREVGIKGFFNRLFGKDDDDTTSSYEERVRKKEKKEKEKKSFFKRLFGGKD
jgi:penicillin-binding protein 1A